MKRISIGVLATLAVLTAAGVALAAGTTNKYKASYSFTGAKTGPLSFTQKIKATAPTKGARTNVIHAIDTTIAGAKIDEAGFPTCTVANINAAKSDSSCPKKALIASGSITAVVASPTPFTAKPTNCTPDVDVWNAGGGKLTFFFVEQGSHQCLGGALRTGSVGPWQGNYHQQGSKVVINDPVPKTVDYPVSGLVGSLVSETLHYANQSIGSKHSIESTGCSGKRNWTFTIVDSLPNKAGASKSFSGSSACG